MLSAENLQLFLFHAKNLDLVLPGIRRGGKYPALILNDFGLGDQKAITLLDTIIENLGTIELRNLALRSNQLTDAIVEKIVKLLQNPLCLIKYLDLSDNKITRAGIDTINKGVAKLPFSLHGGELGIETLQPKPITNNRIIF